MENTISGANENTAVKPATVASSQVSTKVVKTNTKKTKEPIAPVDAAAILMSALKLCQEAGLTVSGFNEGQTLALFIDGLEYSNDKIQVVTLIPQSSNVNSVEK